MAKELVKVEFELPKSDWHKHSIEWLWAEQEENDKFCLRNSPFYAYGYSFLDIVHCERVNGRFIVKDKIKASGHSTYRVFFKEENLSKLEHAKFLDELVKLKCTYEGYNDLYAIDVPPTADIHKIWQLLNEFESKGIWAFEEADYNHPGRK